MERVQRERGARRPTRSEPEYLSVDDMLVTLRDEVLAISRAAEIRTREITSIVTDYARGKTTPAEMHERFGKYSLRWGDPFLGVIEIEGKTDEQLFAEMDAYRKGGSNTPKR